MLTYHGAAQGGGRDAPSILPNYGGKFQLASSAAAPAAPPLGGQWGCWPCVVERVCGVEKER